MKPSVAPIAPTQGEGYCTFVLKNDSGLNLKDLQAVASNNES